MEDKIIRKIDKTIKHIWQYKIKKDYDNGWLLKEDTLKNSIYYHLRKKLGKFFDKNNIRIFTEFTDAEFKHSKKRPDIVIATVDFADDVESGYYGDDIKKCIAIIEIKFKNENAADMIYADFDKLKSYIYDLNLDLKSKLYMATIWEYEDKETCWERKNAAWAKDRLTELNASYKPGTQNMRFYIKEH